jgi:hypothetical protein
MDTAVRRIIGVIMILAALAIIAPSIGVHRNPRLPDSSPPFAGFAAFCLAGFGIVLALGKHRK